MLVHSVYMWLKSDASDADRRACREALEALKDVDTVKQLWIGTPAATSGDPVDKSYDLALTAIFDDVAGEEAYQVSPLHQAFLDKFGGMLDRVRVYDAD